MIPGNEYLEDLPFNYSWSVVNFEPLEMTIQIRFENSTSVSQYAILDRVEIELLPGSFSDTSGRTFPDVTNLDRSIPPQINSDSEEMFATGAAAFSKTLQAVTVGNLALNFLLSASLNYLWSMIEAQQLIVMLPEFNITMTALPNTFVTEFIKISNFDVIEMDQVRELVQVTYPQVEPFNDRLDTVGFGDTYFTNNCGALFLLIIAINLVLVLVLIFRKKKLCGRKQKKHAISR